MPIVIGTLNVFVAMFKNGDDTGIVRVGDKIHSTANTFDELSGNHEVRDITRLGDLHSLQRESKHCSEAGAKACLKMLTPRMATSMWPPRIIAKDSEESRSEKGPQSTSTGH